jgi:N-acetylglucosamine kinase-like BadF-type ATPase
MMIVVGIDGGNSKTLAVVVEAAGTVLSVQRGGGTNHQVVGLDAAIKGVTSLAVEAIAAAGMRPDDIDAAFCTLAGADLPEDFAKLLPALRATLPVQPVGLDNDIHGVLRSGSDNPNAVCVGWGSGTNAAGRNARGQSYRLPALGWYSGDWGGGGDLAREAVWYVARAHDGRGVSTALTEVVCGALGVPDPEAMIHRFYVTEMQGAESNWPCLLAIVPRIFEAADEGDRVAVELVERSAQEIVSTAVALLRRLDLLSVPADVVLGGSIFRTETRLLMTRIKQLLRADAPLGAVILPEVEPAVGAALCALDMLGERPGPQVQSTAKESFNLLVARMEAKAR